MKERCCHTKDGRHSWSNGRPPVSTILASFAKVPCHKNVLTGPKGSNFSFESSGQFYEQFTTLQPYSWQISCQYFSRAINYARKVFIDKIGYDLKFVSCSKFHGFKLFRYCFFAKAWKKAFSLEVASVKAVDEAASAAATDVSPESASTSPNAGGRRRSGLWFLRGGNPVVRKIQINRKREGYRVALDCLFSERHWHVALKVRFLHLINCCSEMLLGLMKFSISLKLYLLTWHICAATKSTLS